MHLKYLAPMLSSEVLNYLIGESMRPDRTSRQIIDGMWKPACLRFRRRAATPGDAISRARSGYCVRRRRPRTWAMSAPRQPLQPSSGCSEKLDVSFGPLLGGMTVERTARDGRSRRYVMSRPFLTQDFADGGQVTASHLRNIIGHLDDYVQS